MNAVQKVSRIDGTITPLRGKDIDTDRIIPARYLKVTRFDTLGEFAFYDERFDAKGTPRAHPLNDPQFKGSNILLVQSNFGSGSSREHAPQALMRYGFQAFVGESFAEIFEGNCLAIGLPVVTLPRSDIADLLERVERDPRLNMVIDLEQQRVTIGDREYPMEMSQGARIALMNGTWDSTNSLLRNIDAVREVATRLPYLNNFQ